ncbi:aminoglycoside resistance protein [Epidermidibacterium keratini]|uniref:Aminoglycoside resistance protein n=1 Tax=Epidermidibacterium keratini TaxID=1891644 RepID=A0A7L4YNN0_9ACTN|nr:aminoglycoside phosphotransferase family protein [Epidermidibacterium keratini]QHC00746.1 aminoglycoside resistance protein [Epidermidibacterium keratini]
MIAASDIPSGLRDQAYLGPDWAQWLERLPRIASDVLDAWDLRRDGDQAWHGCVSLVLPVVTADGMPAVLKVAFDGDDESQHEALALQHWGGDGAVRLLRADPRRRALLLERAQRRDLRSVEPVAACRVVAGLYSRLHIPAMPQLVTVTSYVDRWLTALATLPRDAPIPRRLVEQALTLGRALVGDPASTGVLVHGDLHYENVLAADREPWLVIDPKAMSGDPHYEPAPMLWNRLDDVAPSERRTATRDRFFTLVDEGSLDEDRARDWVIVRMVLNAHWMIEDAERMNRPLSAKERAWMTTCITVAKAVQG